MPAKTAFYFVEDKPYAGIQSSKEAARTEGVVAQHQMAPRLYRSHPEQVVELAFKHYPSQVEQVFRKGVLQRAAQLQSEFGLAHPAERLFYLKTGR